MFKRSPLSYETVIVIMFSILPVVDSLNGILSYAQKGSIGTIYKVLIIGVLAVIVIANDKFSLMSLGCILITIGYIVSTIYVNSMLSSQQIISVDFPIKLIFNLLMFFFLIENIKHGHISGKSIYKILNNNVYVISICILIPYVLGLGKAIYSGNIGYKGFYYSQNELNATLIILLFFSIYKLNRKITMTSLLQVACILLCILLMSTKSSLIACAIGILVYIYEFIRKESGRKKTIMLVMLSVGGIISSSFIISKIVDMLSRQSSLFSMYGGSFLATLTSGRIYTLEEACNQFVNGNNIIIKTVIGNGFFSNKLVEMDFFDIFFYLGVVGVSGIIIFLMYVALKSKRNLKKDDSIIRVTGWLLVIAFSFLTGHVLFMATSGCYFMLFCCFNMTYNDKDEGKYENKD